MLKFRILIDNRPGSSNCSCHSSNLCSEHGLSIFIEYNGTRILCDTGASAAFLENADAMGINLAKTDLCIISHGHSDHTGGLYAFLASTQPVEGQHTNQANVYLSEQIEGEKYYSTRRGIAREISTDSQVFEKYSNRLVPISGSRWIMPEIAVVKCTCSSHPKPHGNKFLGTVLREQYSCSQECSERGSALACICDDTFGHELALAIKTAQGVVIFSPCSHNGLFNIIDSCLNFTGDSRLLAFVGGLHLVDGCETVAEISEMANTFVKKFPDAQLFTGHCTGDMATEVFSSIFSVFYTGFEYIF